MTDIESLPAEILEQILLHVPDFATFKSFVRASPQIHAIYRARLPQSVLTRITLNEVAAKGIDYTTPCQFAKFYGTYHVPGASTSLQDSFRSIWQQLASGTHCLQLPVENCRILRRLHAVAPWAIQKEFLGGRLRWTTKYVRVPPEDSAYWNVHHDSHVAFMGDMKGYWRHEGWERPLNYQAIELTMMVERSRRKPKEKAPAGGV